MTRPPAGRGTAGAGRDRGAGSVLVLGLLAAGLVLAAGVAVLGQAAVAATRAGAAADLAALAGADAALGRTSGSTGGPCAAAARVAAAAGGPLLVLGRGADRVKVDGWLRVAAAQPGFAGFAIGRSIWWEAVQGWLAGGLGPDEVADAVAEGYVHAVRVWTQAAAVRAA